ncbi:uncharacterized protein DS421_12g384430 [Arachis hypogaea]|nr:uncharacterized protein DS421_12g384430 [Arachis hypogaea]
MLSFDFLFYFNFFWVNVARSYTEGKEVRLDVIQTYGSIHFSKTSKPGSSKIEIRTFFNLSSKPLLNSLFTVLSTKVAFPRITKLERCDLPNLKCICSGMQILVWHKLEELEVQRCPMVHIFHYHR